MGIMFAGGDLIGIDLDNGQVHHQLGVFEVPTQQGI